ncbi:MAG TPA: GlxA family transcriptional regulator [Pseudonocardiaceae bacterium]|nr:GlxA family transcriptional regulator [Pseudonocardiaceae bacterium]
MTTRDVLIVLYDDVQSLDLTGPLEVFAAANRVRQGPPSYRLRTMSVDGGPIRTTSGLCVTPDLDLAAATAPHTLVVPGGEGAQHPPLPVIDWLRRVAPAVDRLVSVCSGTFVLAEAGLLTGRRVTTHWGRAEQLAQRYPDLTVDPEPIFIQDGNVYTSAGVTAGMDLALALVEEDLGRDVALTIARQLVMFLRRPANQTQFSAQLSAQVAHRAPLRDVQAWVTEHPEADLSVDTLAQRVGLSPRQFARAFAEEAGISPGRYVDKVRLEAARRHLEDTAADVGQVARTCGYGTPESMRRAFVRTIGVSPAEYRRRFTAARV